MRTRPWSSRVHTVALRTIERWYAAAGGDGIYTRGPDDRLSFRRMVPHTENIERLVDTQAVLLERL